MLLFMSICKKQRISTKGWVTNIQPTCQKNNSVHYHGAVANIHLHRIQLKLTAKHASYESARPNRITYQVVVVIHIVFGEGLKVSARKQEHESPDR